MPMNGAVRERDRMLEVLLLPISLGAGVGVAVGLDAVLRFRVPLDILGYDLTRLIPFLWSLVLVVFLMALFALYAARERIFERRYQIAILLIIGGCQFGGVNYGPLDPLDFVFVLTFSFAVVALLLEHRQLSMPAPLLLMIGAISFFTIASIVNGRVTSIVGAHTILNKVLFVVLITVFVNTRRQHLFALKTFLLFAFLTALIGIASEILYLVAGYDLSMDDLVNYHFKYTPLGRMLRVTAFLPTSQTLGHALVLASCLGLFLPMSPGRRAVLLGSLWTCIVLTFTTGAYVTAALVTILSLFVRRPERTIHYVSALMLAAVLAYISGMLGLFYEKVVLPLGSRGIEDRAEYIRVGLDAVGRHPLLGQGIKNIGRMFSTPIHHTYLQIAADIGVMGGLVFAGMVLYLTVRCGILAAGEADPSPKNTLKGLFLGMVGLGIHLNMEPFYDNSVTWIYMGLVGSAIAVYSRKNDIQI